jgi:predicted sulfurtransferase
VSEKLMDLKCYRPQYEQQRFCQQRKLLEKNGLKGGLLIAMEGVDVHVGL